MRCVKMGQCGVRISVMRLFCVVQFGCLVLAMSWKSVVSCILTSTGSAALRIFLGVCVRSLCCRLWSAEVSCAYS